MEKRTVLRQTEFYGSKTSAHSWWWTLAGNHTLQNIVNKDLPVQNDELPHFVDVERNGEAFFCFGRKRGRDGNFADLFRYSDYNNYKQPLTEISEF